MIRRRVYTHGQTQLHTTPWVGQGYSSVLWRMPNKSLPWWPVTFLAWLEWLDFWLSIPCWPFMARRRFQCPGRWGLSCDWEVWGKVGGKTSPSFLKFLHFRNKMIEKFSKWWGNDLILLYFIFYATINLSVKWDNSPMNPMCPSHWFTHYWLVSVN